MMVVAPAIAAPWMQLSPTPPAPNTATVVPGAGEALVLRLDTVTPVDLSSDNAQRLAGLVKDQAANAVAQDLFRAYNTDLQARAGVTVDQAAVNAVLTNFR